MKIWLIRFKRSRTPRVITVATLSFCTLAHASSMSGPDWKKVSFTTAEDQTVTLTLRKPAQFNAQVSTIDVLIDTGECRINETIELAGFADLTKVGLFNAKSDQGDKYYSLYIGAIDVDADDSSVQHHVRRYFEIRHCALRAAKSVSTDAPAADGE